MRMTNPTRALFCVSLLSLALGVTVCGKTEAPAAAGQAPRAVRMARVKLRPVTAALTNVTAAFPADFASLLAAHRGIVLKVAASYARTPEDRADA